MPTFCTINLHFTTVCCSFYNQKKKSTISIWGNIRISSMWNPLLHFSIRLMAKFWSQAHTDHVLPFSNILPTSIPSTYTSHPELLAVVFLFLELYTFCLFCVEYRDVTIILSLFLIIDLPPTGSYYQDSNLEENTLIFTSFCACYS